MRTRFGFAPRCATAPIVLSRTPSGLGLLNLTGEAHRRNGASPDEGISNATITISSTETSLPPLPMSIPGTTQSIRVVPGDAEPEPAIMEGSQRLRAAANARFSERRLVRSGNGGGA